MQIDRYQRQIALPQIGPVGQARLSGARALLIGCGALGCTMAEQLVRAGLGHLCIVDRDLVEQTNLQRQVLFDEEDARQSLPKAVAAQKRLRQINSTVHIEARVLDVHAGNLEDLFDAAAGFDLVLDGTDNAETRYLLNDLAVKRSVPWIYGACVGTEGRVMLIRSPQTACLRCIFPEPPQPGELATCDTVGVLGSAAAVVGSIQAAAAIRLITDPTLAPQHLLVLDLWASRFHTVSMEGAKRDDCPCCGRHRFDFLDSLGESAGATTALCGRNSIQLRPGRKGSQIDLPSLSHRLQPVGELELTPYFLRCSLHDPEGITLTIFPDARIIISGTTDPARARALTSRYIGT